MVLLVTTSRIVTAIDFIPLSDREQLDFPKALSEGEPISHKQLIGIAQYFRKRETAHNGKAITEDKEEQEEHEYDSDATSVSSSSSSSSTSTRRSVSKLKAPSPLPSFTLNDLLRGTKVYKPPPPKKPEPVCPSSFLLLLPLPLPLYFTTSYKNGNPKGLTNRLMGTS